MKYLAISICMFSWLTPAAQTLSSKQELILPDSIGPIEVYFELVDSIFLKTEAGDDKTYEVYLDKFISLNAASYYDDSAFLLYRYHHSNIDSGNLFVKIGIPFYSITSVDTVNLNNQGSAELIVLAQSCSFGSGGGTCSKGTLIYDLTENPKLLFKVIHGFSEEVFPRLIGDYEMREGYLNEYNRKVSIENQEIVIHKNSIKKLREFEQQYGPLYLTKIPSGTYVYVDKKVKKR